MSNKKKDLSKLEDAQAHVEESAKNPTRVDGPHPTAKETVDELFDTAEYSRQRIEAALNPLLGKTIFSYYMDGAGNYKDMNTGECLNEEQYQDAKGKRAAEQSEDKLKGGR